MGGIESSEPRLGGNTPPHRNKLQRSEQREELQTEESTYGQNHGDSRCMNWLSSIAFCVPKKKKRKSSVKY